jgi:uncharacterized 2Fe-2S/4Fe-4S cluster protein (DUF4445 family)
VVVVAASAAAEPAVEGLGVADSVTVAAVSAVASVTVQSR